MAERKNLKKVAEYTSRRRPPWQSLSGKGFTTEIAQAWSSPEPRNAVLTGAALEARSKQ